MRAIRILESVGGQETRVRTSVEMLVETYGKWNLPDSAAAWRERLEAAEPTE